MNAYATILEKGRGWVTIAHHPGGIDTVIGRFTAKYQAKACADTFNNAAARDAASLLDDADVYAEEVAVHGDIVVELVAAVERHSNMLADLVRLIDRLERRVAALEHPKPVH